MTEIHLFFLNDSNIQTSQKVHQQQLTLFNGNHWEGGKSFMETPSELQDGLDTAQVCMITLEQMSCTVC